MLDVPHSAEYTGVFALPVAFQQKLDELRTSGCTQRMTWSKLGCIAYITPNATGVETRHIMCNPKDGRWGLSSNFPIPNVSRTHEGNPILHVMWNSVGTELAVIDNLGRLSIYTVFMSVNMLQCTRNCITDQEDDLSCLAGFWWLNTDKQYATYRTAVKDDKGFRYPAHSQKSLGPYHPTPNKAACMGLSRTGMLKLWYQGEQNRYLDSTYELERWISGDDLFSHASFSPDKDNHIILAAYTLSKELRVYRICINWVFPPQQVYPQASGQPPPPSPPPSSATLVVKRIKVDKLGTLADSVSLDITDAFLTHLEVLSPTLSAPNQTFPTTIMAIFCANALNCPTSVITRWILRESIGTLHPSFDQLGVRRGSASSQSTKEVVLHRLSDDVILNKCVIAVSHLPSSCAINFSCIDGSVETRDRANFRLFEPKPSPDVVQNMLQAGFDFPAPNPSNICMGLSLSPNGVLTVKYPPDGDIEVTPMEYVYGSLNPAQSPLNFQSACVALAQQHASGCNNLVNNDDLLMVVYPYRDEVFNKYLLNEVHRALNLKMDFTAEAPNERLFRNPVLQRCLSLQTSLYYKGENTQVSLGAKLAWIFLHLRIASLGFGTTINHMHRGQRDELKPEALQPLIGISKWSMDLIAYLIEDLIQLARAVGDRIQDREYIRSIAFKRNSPGIFVILASGSRVLARYNSRGLRSTESSGNLQLQSQVIDLFQRQILQSLRVIFEQSPVKVIHFERIVNDVDGTVRSAYHTLTDHERVSTEREVFINNEIPSVLGIAVERLLRNIHTLMKSPDIDMASLFFHDLSWLGLDDDPRAIASRKSRCIDAIRKTEIPKGKPLRQCTRCCSVTEDFTNSRQTNWLVSMQRMCFCGSLWMAVKE